jgi:hypothetical protein
MTIKYLHLFLGIKHENYNMMDDKISPKCKLIPRTDLEHLITVCFDMSAKMLGKLIVFYDILILRYTFYH